MKKSRATWRRIVSPSLSRVCLVVGPALSVFAVVGTGSRPAPAAARAPDAAFVERVLSSLTPDERIGQLVMVNFVNDDVGSQSDIASLIRDFKVGSVLVTASNGNIVNRGDTPAQLAALTNGLQQRSFEATHRLDGSSQYYLPLLIATDNEGDLFPLTNVTNGYTSVPNNMTIGATWDKDQAEAAGKIVGGELSAAGVNMLLGPVVDVLDNPRSGGNGDIGVRSFGGDPAWVGQLGRAYIRGVHTGSGGKMLTVAKHFPGHGGSDRSTDSEVPVVNKSLEQLRATELAPFAAAVREEASDPMATTDGLMVSHIRYRNFLGGGGSPFTGPISLDSTAFHGLMDLPEFAAWRGNHLVMSDSLGVPAVKKWYEQQSNEPGFPNRTVVKDALMAGSDLLPLVEFFHDPDHRGWKDNQLTVIQDSIIFMREQYVADPDFRRRVDDAVRHVISAKLTLYPSFTIAQALVDPAHASTVAGSGADAMRTLSEDALTLIQPPTIAELKSRLPRGPQSPEKIVIVECWEDCYPYSIKPRLDLQNALLAEYGPSRKGRLKPEDVSTITFGELNAWIDQPNDPSNAATAKALNDAAWVFFALAEYNPNAYPASGAVKRFLDATPIDVRNKNLVAVAYNAPYHLDSTEISKLSAYFAVYSKTAASIDTGFRALFGDVVPKGHSPVSVSGIFYNVADAVHAAPDQKLTLVAYGQDPQSVRESQTVGLVAGAILDGNGNRIADGALVSFSLSKDGDTAAPKASATAFTVDGIAAAQLPLRGAGRYIASATSGAIASEPLQLTVGGSGAVVAATAPPAEQSNTASNGGGTNVPLLALAIGPPAVMAVAAGAAVVLLYRRRRLLADAGPARVADAASPETAPPISVLRVDAETRRVYVRGIEAKPPLSNEQFRLLSYLYERSGKVVAREELVAHVWPDAHVEGVSEEALDALVRRVRERIVQAGGERSYIVTLRGHGFRLEIDEKLGAAATAATAPPPSLPQR